MLSGRNNTDALTLNIRDFFNGKCLLFLSVGVNRSHKKNVDHHCCLKPKSKLHYTTCSFVMMDISYKKRKSNTFLSLFFPTALS